METKTGDNKNRNDVKLKKNPAARDNDAINDEPVGWSSGENVCQATP